MERISIKNYKRYMGKLIDVRHPIDYLNNNHPDSVNIHYSKIMNNPSGYLNKNEKYYIYCDKGLLSRKVANYLDYLKYDIVIVTK